MENKSAVLTAVQKIEMRPAPMPEPKPDEVLIRLEYCGVCGSDVHFFEDGYIGKRYATFPMVLGHEAAGTVVSAGSQVHDLKEGDRVAIEPGIPCGHCEYCKEGRYNLCRDLVFLSTPPYDGVLSRYITHPAHLSHKLPEQVSLLEGSLIEPLAVGMHAARLGNICSPKTAVILGAGCIGLTTLLACRQMGASKIIISDLYENRLKKALELGADHVVNASEGDPVEQILALTGGAGADVVFESAGNKHTAYQTSLLVRNGGTIVLVGNIIGDITFNFRNMTLKEADLKTVWRYRNVYPAAIDSIAKGTIPVKDIVTRIYDFDESQQAFETAMNDKQNVVKAVIHIE
ncbi:NAD(P)-dependent alcohol dehydrogenase [Anaerolentibacter hominis]|uniref:NAD(P)-dependent alcohol dehydrogenase n=1 Tax=Anaerolentibacter hominis TaxID=3079009 RepID=UPI0031B82775